jgi:hypothetical protein
VRSRHSVADFPDKPAVVEVAVEVPVRLIALLDAQETRSRGSSARLPPRVVPRH